MNEWSALAEAHTYIADNKHSGPASKSLSGSETVLPATKQLNQQGRRLLIFCMLNFLFLNTLRSYDVIFFF